MKKDLSLNTARFSEVEDKDILQQLSELISKRYLKGGEIMKKDLSLNTARFSEVEDKDILQQLSELSNSDKEIITKLIERLRKED